MDKYTKLRMRQKGWSDMDTSSDILSKRVDMLKFEFEKAFEPVNKWVVKLLRKFLK